MAMKRGQKMFKVIKKLAQNQQKKKKKSAIKGSKKAVSGKAGLSGCS
jgi:hypothetical protein